MARPASCPSPPRTWPPADRWRPASSPPPGGRSPDCPARTCSWATTTSAPSRSPPWDWGGPWGRGTPSPLPTLIGAIDHVLTDLWPTGPDGLPLADEAAVAAAGTAGADGAGSPLLRAVDWGTASFIISDHVGTWVDLEPVG